jgi:branched-chain amino acid transport system ATP-binding protein
LYLSLKDVSVLYDRALVLNEVSLQLGEGEAVGLVGPNGAGKSTLFRAIAGLIKWEMDTLRGTVLGKITLKGSIIFDGQEMIHLPAHEIVKRGLILCPERGRPFREMTVKENLEVGAYLMQDKKETLKSMESIFQLFPVLKTRMNQISGTLSGGERTMLSIGRSLMSNAKLLLIDEPSVGLGPLAKEDLFARIKSIRNLGLTIFLAEQDVSFAFDLTQRNFVLSRGKVIAEGTAQELLGNELITKTYLGL